MSEAPKKRWYVVQAFSGFEGRVATSLREHIKLHNTWLKSVAVSVAKANVNSSLATSSFRW